VSSNRWKKFQSRVDWRIEESATLRRRDNIAEGFGRYGHREFSRFLTIAKGSLDENESQLLGGLRKRYFSEEAVQDGRDQIELVRKKLLRLKRYLDNTDGPSSRRS
jgi:hypothetical protein